MTNMTNITHLRMMAIGFKVIMSKTEVTKDLSSVLCRTILTSLWFRNLQNLRQNYASGSSTMKQSKVGECSLDSSELKIFLRVLNDSEMKAMRPCVTP